MSKLSRDKGKLGERELCHAFDAAELDYVREQDGRTQGCDFRIGAIVLEARRRNRLDILAWSREVEAKAPDHLTPALAFRPDREPWRVSMPLDDWITLVKAAQQ